MWARVPWACVGFERKGNKPGKPAGLILELTQLAQMIGALRDRFDVSVEHGAGAATPHRVPGPMHIEPFGGRFFAAADLVAHEWIENFGATAGDRTKSGLAQSFQGVANRHLEHSLGQMSNLDRGERLDVQLSDRGHATGAKDRDTNLSSSSDAVRPPCALR